MVCIRLPDVTVAGYGAGQFFQPGAAIDLRNADTSAAGDLIGKTREFSVTQFVEHVFPRSIFEAMATNEILQIVIFSIFLALQPPH